MTALKAILSRLHVGGNESAPGEADRRPVGERRKAERRGNVVPFYDREKRLRFAAEAAGFGTYDLDCATGHNHWSPELNAMAGLPPDSGPASLGQVEELIHPDDRRRFLEKLRASLDPRGSGELEDDYRMVRPDGAMRWVKIRGRTFFAGAGAAREPLAATGVVMDVTASRAAEQELLESRAELAGLVDSAIDAIISIDADQRIVRFNQAACRMFRCTAETAIGSPLERFIPERFREAHRSHVAKFAEGGVTARTMGLPGVFSGMRSDGEEFPIEASIAKVEVGCRRWMTVFLQDITERKRAEDALRQSHERLEYCVEERTAELMQANEALERSNLELQQFAFIAAHDLQTPLRSISGFAQLLKKDYSGRFDPQADAWLDQMVRSVHRMRDVIHDVLAYSRVESRGNVFRPVDFRHLFDDVVAILDAPIRETGARVTRGDLPMVMGDRTQLAQVLQNLIDNALKYHAGDGAPAIHVSARQERDEWVFSIEDNGIGIADKHLEQIFDIFRRLHSQQEYPGTGIGLAICRRVIHRHGGRIWAESRQGEGSTFYFTLPERQREAT
jgi:PAS domain S-box-containing protein